MKITEIENFDKILFLTGMTYTSENSKIGSLVHGLLKQSITIEEKCVNKMENLRRKELFFA